MNIYQFEIEKYKILYLSWKSLKKINYILKSHRPLLTKIIPSLIHHMEVAFVYENLNNLNVDKWNLSTSMTFNLPTTLVENW